MKKRIILTVVTVVLAVTSWQLVKHGNQGRRNDIRQQSEADRSLSVASDDGRIIPGTGADGTADGSPVDIALLHSRFPGNRTLPPLTEKDSARIKGERSEREKLYARINANRATETEIHHYYREQEEIARDGIELAAYILREYEGRLGFVERKKQEFLVDQFKKRLVLIPRREKEALDRIGKH
jgi:hypothetical protein